MNKLRIVSTLTFLIMASAGIGMSVMASEAPAATQDVTGATAETIQTAANGDSAQAANQPATAEPTDDALTAARIVGVWEGEYSGTSSGEPVKREITITVTECTDDGSFTGYAAITSTPGEQYTLSGSIDFETGKMSFKGTEWLINLKLYSFNEFIGSVDWDKKEFSGLINGKEGRDFCLTKTSDTAPVIPAPEAVCREWYGEYDGYSGSTTVRRNIKLSISEISETGLVKGMAVISPSDQAEAMYSLDGSYYFEGEYHPECGFIKLQGNEWIDRPNPDFTFIEFYGNISDNGINGITETGIWTMTRSKILKGDLNFDNKINVADLVIMQRYLLSDYEFNNSLFYYADMNDDCCVDSFDLVFLRKEIIRNWIK